MRRIARVELDKQPRDLGHHVTTKHPHITVPGNMSSFDQVESARATWTHHTNKGGLQVLVEGDERMFNQYGVVLVNPAKHPQVKKELGQQFIDWLVSPEGQQAIANYKINGEQLYFPNATDPNG